MRLSNPLLSILISFLLGVAWAFVIFGAVFAFQYSYANEQNIFNSLISAFFGLLPGLFFVLFIEYFLMIQDKIDNIEKKIDQFKND